MTDIQVRSHENEGHLHVFPVDDGPFVPSEADLERARFLEINVCPRRYCFHWDSASFHWERTPEEGCLFLIGEKPGWKFAGIPCCRSDQSSIVDQFDPNEWFADADGMDVTKWVENRLENQRVILQIISDPESLRPSQDKSESEQK